MLRLSPFPSPALSLLFVFLANSAQAETLSNQEFRSLKRQAQATAAVGDMEALARVVGELGRDDSKRAVDLIARIVTGEAELSVYEAARTALGRMHSAEAVDHMAGSLERRGGNPRVKMLVIDAFAERDDERSASALGASLGAKQPEVQRAAVSAIRNRKASQAVLPMIQLLEQLEGGRQGESLLLVSLRETLVEITGRSFENASDWRKYWQIVQDQGVERVVTGDAREPLKTGERAPKPTFFGTEIKSNRLVFVVDVSGSMAGERLQQTKEQLKKIVDELHPKSRFTILAYSAGCRVWHDELSPANERTKEQAKAFVDGLQASGNTKTLTAMKAAFQVEGPDAIVLLSDGYPTENDPATGAQMDNDAILSEIAQLNRWKRWRVDTFGFGVGDFMGALADQNGGSYTDIE